MMMMMTSVFAALCKIAYPDDYQCIVWGVNQICTKNC